MRGGKKEHEARRKGDKPKIKRRSEKKMATKRYGS